MTPNQHQRLFEYLTILLTLEVEAINDATEEFNSRFLDAAMFGIAFSIDGKHIPAEQIYNDL